MLKRMIDRLQNLEARVAPRTTVGGELEFVDLLHKDENIEQAWLRQYGPDIPYPRGAGFVIGVVPPCRDHCDWDLDAELTEVEARDREFRMKAANGAESRDAC